MHKDEVKTSLDDDENSNNPFNFLFRVWLFHYPNFLVISILDHVKEEQGVQDKDLRGGPFFLKNLIFPHLIPPLPIINR